MVVPFTLELVYLDRIVGLAFKIDLSQEEVGLTGDAVASFQQVVERGHSSNRTLCADDDFFVSGV